MTKQESLISGGGRDALKRASANECSWYAGPSTCVRAKYETRTLTHTDLHTDTPTHTGCMLLFYYFFFHCYLAWYEALWDFLGFLINAETILRNSSEILLAGHRLTSIRKLMGFIGIRFRELSARTTRIFFLFFFFYREEDLRELRKRCKCYLKTCGGFFGGILSDFGGYKRDEKKR